MKLSIVIICWNDFNVIRDCLRSIYACGYKDELEVIVSDNGSTDGSLEFIRREYPDVHLFENNTNLGFAAGNNVGIRASNGRYVLILNPDTIVHEGTLSALIDFADGHLEAGAFGCRVLNPDGSYQSSARPFPTIWRSWIAALYLRPLAYISNVFVSDTYTGWNGDTQRVIDWQSGCCVMFRGDLLKSLNGFDEQFFYHFEEVDLCRRVWDLGQTITYTPEAKITHLGGQSVNRFPIHFELERYRNRYRYFYKHFGPKGAWRCRQAVLAKIRVRQLGYGLLNCLAPSALREQQLKMYRLSAQWNRELDPVQFVQCGEEPRVLRQSDLAMS